MNKMKKMRKLIAMATCVAMLSTMFVTGGSLPVAAAMSQTAIANPETEYMENPIGIDVANPRFSWNMDSNLIGQGQQAYRILVHQDTVDGKTVWDSGEVASDASVGIQYAGDPLEASTRYYWTVTVTDLSGGKSTSEPSFFETGLMTDSQNDWNGAEWIGTPQTSTNTAAVTQYVINYDVTIPEGQTKSGFAFAARDQRNYQHLEINLEGTPRLTVHEVFNGEAKNNTIDVDLSAVLTEDKLHAANSVQIAVSKPNGSNNYITIKINGEVVVDNQNKKLPSDPSNSPRKNCLNQFGFVQEGSTAVYDNLSVKAVTFKSNSQTNSSEYTKEIPLISDDFSDAGSLLSTCGEVVDGQLVVSDAFELRNANPSPTLRDTFTVEDLGDIASARLYASARGIYKASINGQPVSENYFDPGFTEFAVRIQYQTFDVTDKLVEGENAIGAILGKGWYNGYCGYSGPNKHGEENSFLAMLRVEYKDGSSAILTKTDDSWKYTDRGPFVDTDFLDGEVYDARLEMPGWDTVNCDDSSWQNAGIKARPAESVKPKNGNTSYATGERLDFKLSAQIGPSAKIVQELPALSVKETSPGVWAYDLGQNMVGVPRITVKGEAGEQMQVRFGEMSYKDGTVYNENYRTAYNTEVYTLKGDPDGETYTPTFTYTGFRYIEITGVENPPALEDVTGLVICNIDEVSGDFMCSDELINQLQSNIQWGQRGNYLMVPTDCPQRNERMGWTGDAQVFSGTAAYNMDVMAFLNKWLQDMRDSQLYYNRDGAVPDTVPLGGDNRGSAYGCSGWADAGVMVPWSLYLAYGDKQILEDCYDIMADYVAYQDNPKYRQAGTKTDLPYLVIQQRRGDHLTFDETTPFVLTGTAYAAHVADLMTRVATILGKEDDAAKYAERFENVKRAFQEEYVQEDGSIAYMGEMSKSNKDINGNVIKNTYYSNGLVTDEPANTGLRVDNGELVVPANSGFLFEKQSFSGDYTIEVTTTVQSKSFGIMFGSGDPNSSSKRPAMWQFTFDGANGIKTHMPGNWGTRPIYNDDSIKLNTPLTMKIEVVGNTVNSYANGKLLNTCTLPDGYSTTGPVGFRSVEGENFKVDSLKVTQNGATVFEDNFDSMDYDKWNYPAPPEPSEPYENPNHPSQTSYAVAIDFGLIPEENLDTAANYFKQAIDERDGHLSVGFLGIAHLNPALTKTGQDDVAYSLLEQKSNPSWLYSVLQGATTIWERWNSYIAETDTFGDVSMNSFNHYSYGAIGEWMYGRILGINIDEAQPGYKHIVLDPMPGGTLNTASGYHDSMYGTITSGWAKNDAGELVSYSVEIPANTTATLYLPLDASGVNEVQGVTYVGTAQRYGKTVAQFELKSGGYDFTVENGQLVAALGKGYVTAEQGVSKTILQKVIEYAQQQDTSNLIPTVEANFNAALQNAVRVNADPAASQSEVDTAWAELMNQIHFLGFVKGDKEALALLVESCQALDLSQYESGQAKDAFVAALAAAEVVLADGDAMQGEIDEAHETLQNALNALVKIDKSQLNKVIEEANKIDLTKMVDNGQAEFTAALEKAVAVSGQEEVTQAEINNACQALIDAMLALRYKADKSVLEQTLASTAGIDPSLYTAESVDAYNAARAEAEAVLKDNSLSEDDQAAVNAAADKLQKAYDALTSVGTTVQGDSTVSTANSAPKTGEAVPFAAAALLLLSMAGAVALKKRSR